MKYVVILFIIIIICGVSLLILGLINDTQNCLQYKSETILMYDPALQIPVLREIRICVKRKK